MSSVARVASRREGEEAPGRERAGARDGARVLILSADIGEGHDLPARAIAQELTREDPSVRVTVTNGLPDMGRLLSLVLRDGSWFVLRHIPWAFELEYRLAARLRPTRWLAQRLLYALSRRGLLRRIAKEKPDAVVSTYPGLTAALGELRRRRRIDVPVYSAITDLASLRYWAHPGIDMHFVTHPESIEEVERITGPGTVRWARPPISGEFHEPRDRAAARRALGVPAVGRVVVVSGGGWGVGDLAGAVDAVMDSQPDATVVCLAGRNEQLRQRLERRYASQPRVRVMGFTDRMGDLLAAADALVHSTAGLTVLEALIRGCPVISYGFAVGHVRVNNAAFARFGLARTARSPTALAVAVEQALARRGEPDPSFARRPTISSSVLEGRPQATPLPAWRLRLGRVGATATASFLLTAVTLSIDGAYGLLARPLDLRPLTSVSTDRREVGLLVDAPPRLVPQLTRELARKRVRVSFAVSSAISASTLAHVTAAGDEAIPQLSGSRVASWVNTQRQLKRSARRLGLSGHFLYALPHDGFTLGQYLLAHAAGARPVSGAIRYTGGAGQLSGVRAGDVVEVSLRSGASTWTQAVASVTAQCRRHHLQPVPVSDLARLPRGSSEP